LENSIFFMLNGETGSMVLPTRDEQDGIFHVTGKVTVSKDVQLETLLDKLEPLLSGYPDNLKSSSPVPGGLLCYAPQGGGGQEG
jgi:hypothetical protein